MDEIKTISRTIDVSNLIDVTKLTSSDESICGIYLIYNKINSKIYIGQSRNIYRRWKSHCERYSEKRKCKNRPVIDRAIAKYGKENFACFVLEYFETSQEELNKKEKYWAEMYLECYLPAGYNNKICGEQNSRILSSCVEVSNYDDDGNIIKTFESASDAIAEYGNGILQCIKDIDLYHKSSGYY